MGAFKLLVLAEPYERDSVRAAAVAVGGTVIGAEADDDLAQVVSSARADAVVLAGGAATPDPAAIAGRLRVLAGAETPIVFLGEPTEVAAVERLVDAAFPRPTQARAVVSRAIALSVRGPEATRSEPWAIPPTGPLRALQVSIDDALNAEMLSVLRAVAEPPRTVTPPARARSGADAPVGGSAPLPGTDTFDELREILGSELSNGAEAGRREALTGTLEEVDVPLLMGRIFNAGTTGRLVVESASIERTIYFEAGRPVFASSSHPDDRLVAMLVRQRRLTRAQHQTALKAAQASGRKMGALLVDLGLVETGELLPIIRQHYEELALSLFCWTTGRWRLEPGVMARPTQIRLLRHPATLVRQGLRRSDGSRRIWDRLGSLNNVFIVDLGGRASEVLGALVSTAAERRLPMLFDGVRPLGEVVRLAGLPEREAAELIFALLAFSLLRPTVVGAAAERDRFAVRDRDLERERILTRHALALEADYFDVLGLTRGASPDEVQRAYDLLLRDLTPARLGRELSRAVAGELETIREVAEEALRVLSTDPLRNRYEAQLRREPAARG